jgi:hypothetical protein
MSRCKLLHPPRGVHSVISRSRREFCFCATAVYTAALLLWIFAGNADALTGLTEPQCVLLLSEFRQTFVRSGDGYPDINSCESQIVRLMWDQQIQRVYSDDVTLLNDFQVLRSLPDAQFAKLVVNAAAGSLMDSSQQGSDDAMVRIRVDSHGHFQRYVQNDSNRITTLQTMLVMSIVTLAVTWWRIDMRQRMTTTVP